jgi:RNA processing factor Prp31
MFTSNTIVDPSTNSFIPEHGFELIEAEDVKKKGSSFRYLVGKYFQAARYDNFVNNFGGL